MEENTKVMEGAAQAEEPTYEQLEEQVRGLRSMNNQLIMQLQQLNVSHLFKRLDYLFKVLKYKDSLNPEFVTACSKEIEVHLTLPEQESEDKE